MNTGSAVAISVSSNRFQPKLESKISHQMLQHKYPIQMSNQTVTTEIIEGMMDHCIHGGKVQQNL